MSTSRSLAALGLPLLVCLLLTEIKGDCDPDVGPAGSLRCIRSDLYDNQYQYATCHTSSYILQKSKGKILLVTILYCLFSLCNVMGFDIYSRFTMIKLFTIALEYIYIWRWWWWWWLLLLLLLRAWRKFHRTYGSCQSRHHLYTHIQQAHLHSVSAVSLSLESMSRHSFLPTTLKVILYV